MEITIRTASPSSSKLIYVDVNGNTKKTFLDKKELLDYLEELIDSAQALVP